MQKVYEYINKINLIYNNNTNNNYYFYKTKY